MSQTLLISAMRNEAPYLLEWVVYHRAIGFTDILIYSNDCEDGTDVMLDHLETMGLVTHVRNDDILKKGVQWTALERAQKHPLMAQAEWVLFADVDEFVNIKLGAGHLDDLKAAATDADAFALQWRYFGNAGVLDNLDDLVIDGFKRAAPMPCHFPWKASQFKTLFRNDGAYQKLGIHRPKKLQEGKAPKWVNSAGKHLPQSFAQNGVVTYGPLSGTDWVQLNHYGLRSALGFLVKTQRGLPNRAHREIGLEYWIDRNFNQFEDTSICRHVDAVQAARINLLKDAKLNELHQAAILWHRKLAVKLANTEDGSKLLARMLSTQRTDLPARYTKQMLKLLGNVQKRRVAEGKKDFN